MNKWYKKYMIFIGIFGQCIFFAQFCTIILNKSAENVSLFGFICGFASSLSWLIYGSMLRDLPLIVTNTVATIGAILTIIAIFIYS